MSENENVETPIVGEPPKVPDVEPWKARMTVVETVYHQLWSDDPTEISCRFSVELEMAEEPYQRKKRVGVVWETLDTGWIKGRVGTVVIINGSRKMTQGLPSEEEKEAIAKQVILLRFSKDSDGDVRIPPKESFRFRPHTSELPEIRCEVGEARYKIFIVPR